MMSAVTSPRQEAGSTRPSRKTRPSHTARFGEHLQQARQLRRLSQTELAAAIGVSKQSISAWEAGDSPPTLEHLEKLATALGIRPGDLLNGVSSDLTYDPLLAGRLRATTRLLPVLEVHQAGGLLMDTLSIEVAEKAPQVATLRQHAPGSVAFTVSGEANAPRFDTGDVVVIEPCTITEPGVLVMAFIKARANEPFVFRRFLPKVEGRLEGGTLRALNPMYPDIVLTKSDQILGRFSEHISVRQN